MQQNKAEIIARLKKDIFPLGGFKELSVNTRMDTGLGIIKDAFPGGTFPLGAVHEFLSVGAEATAASGGFMAAIIGRLMKEGGISIWIGSTKTLFPPALLAFGIRPDNVIFIDLKRDKEVLWIMEECLKCAGLAAVVGEIRDLTLTTSRRLQLAVEQSKVTGFVLRINPAVINPTSCVTRWRIAPLPSKLQDELPGVGFPRWTVTLEKVRNGKPGIWNMEWKAGKFRLMADTALVQQEQEQRKTG